MDAKKKKIRILSCIAAVIIVAAVAVSAFAIYKYTRKDNVTAPEDVNQQVEYSLYTQAITERQVPKNYKGIYQFSRVSGVEFNLKDDEYPTNDYRNKYRLSEDDIYVLYNANNIKNRNDLIIDLMKKKTDQVNEDDEYLSFETSLKGYNSYFNVLKGSNALTDDDKRGTFYGDDDVIMVTTLSGEVFFASFKYSSILYDAAGKLTLNGEKEVDYTKLYVSKTVYSQNRKYLLFTMTYEYKLCDLSTEIPKEDLVY